MKLRYRIPLSANVSGASADALDLKCQFKHNDLIVKIGLSGEKPLSSDSFPKERRYFRKVNTVDIFIEEIEIESVKESEYPKLLRLLTPITNRVLRSIRNFGILAYINEIYPRDADAEHYLRRWKVELSEDGKKWGHVVSEDFLKDLIFLQVTEKSGELSTTLWPDIEEAIQDNLDPLPEQEFIINALEHLKNRNYRLALIESILCLEIVMSQYLNKYMSIQKKIPPQRINTLLSPQLGLYGRVSALLNLCLYPDDISKIEFNNVLKAINWRNNIIHKTGHLPDNLPEDTIYQNISSVLQLVSLLAARRNQIEISPEFQEIAKSISEKHKVPIPNIWLTGRHQFLIEFAFFVIPSNFPDAQVLESLAQEASALLSALDTRFKPEEHLYIRYLAFREIRARWYKGSLHLVQIPEEAKNN